MIVIVRSHGQKIAYRTDAVQRADRGRVPDSIALGVIERRTSAFMHGAEDGVREFGALLADYLDRATQVQAACLLSI